MRSVFLPKLTASALVLGTSILSVLPFSSVSAEAMNEAVRTAITNHPAVERAAISADVARQDINEQRSEFFPKVSTTLTGGRLYGDNATSRGLSVTRGAGYSWLWEGNAAVNQMLFDWNQTSNRVDAAEAERMAALYSYDDARESIAFQTVQSYIALHKAQTLYDEAQAYLSAMRDYRARIRKLVDGGGADEAEGSRARDLVLAAENMIAGLKGQLKAAEASYKEVVGELPQTSLEKPEMPFLLDDDQNLDVLIRKIQDHHPQIKAALEQVESQEYTISADEKEVLPQVGSEFSYNKKDQDDIIGGESVDARAVVRMTWNLDTGGAQFARAKKAKLQKDQTLTQVEELRRSLERSLRISMAGLDMAVEQRDIQKKRYDELVSTLSTYKKQFEASQKRLLEVATTESQVFAAKNEYLASEYAVLDAAYAFLSSQGDLTDALDILAIMNAQGPEEQNAEQKTAMAPQQPVAEFVAYSAADRSVEDEQLAVLKVAQARKPLSFEASEVRQIADAREAKVETVTLMEPIIDEPMIESIEQAALNDPVIDEIEEINLEQTQPMDDVTNVQMSPVMNEPASVGEGDMSPLRQVKVEISAPSDQALIDQIVPSQAQDEDVFEIVEDSDSGIDFVPFSAHTE